MEERILVPLDGTKTGEAIIAKLEDLVLRASPRMDTQVTLLQIISKMNYSMLTSADAAQLPPDAEELEETTQKAQKYLEGVAEKLRAKGITVNTRVARGHTAEEIVKVAHEIDAHLIAMSTHETNGFVRWAIGSVTNKVMRLEGKIPVLAVRASDKEERSPVLTMESLQSLVKHN